jgi:hypothetical protein
VIITNPGAPVNFIEDYSKRSATSLGLQWQEGAFNGGTQVLDYQVSFDQGTDTYVVLATTLLGTNYEAVGLTSGQTYKFKVQARNSFGLSDYSTELTLMAAFKPDQPLPPVTSVVAADVIILWQAPTANGSPITSYRITIGQSNGDFTQEMSYCDGSISSIVTDRECTVPLSVLTDPAVYSLSLGDSVYAKVVAINFYGESIESDGGNGATVLVVPSAPVNLQDDTSVTTATVIGFTWSNGISTGGSPILDYRVSYD